MSGPVLHASTTASTAHRALGVLIGARELVLFVAVQHAADQPTQVVDLLDDIELDLRVEGQLHVVIGEDGTFLYLNVTMDNGFVVPRQNVWQGGSAMSP